VQRFVLEHDDGTDDNSTVDAIGSETSLEAANNNDDWDEPDDDDNDEGEELMGKASVNEYLRTNDDANRPGKLPSSSHPSSSNSRHNGSDQIP
jgi:hypothetical protein